MIGDFLHCIKSCCEEADDESTVNFQLLQRFSRQDSSYDPPSPSSAAIMTRGDQDNASEVATVPSTETIEFGSAGGQDSPEERESNCEGARSHTESHRNGTDTTTTTTTTNNNNNNNSSQRRGRRRRALFFWRQPSSYEEVNQLENADTITSPSKTFDTLKAASTFTKSHDIPSISTEEIVMPGSDLQTKMAEAMAETLEEQGDECVICMETFSPENPRMPTFCGCGENKTAFHLPCLYQWTAQSRNCPSCRQELVWEEF